MIDAEKRSNRIGDASERLAFFSLAKCSHERERGGELLDLSLCGAWETLVRTLR